ncbi:fungal-specific transcription factor domain-containing protein [Xylariaceae sp. FL0255]|nr:fungal-specific transcription factor domain-containing protein [Xylariaceae sp. FL0255]
MIMAKSATSSKKNRIKEPTNRRCRPERKRVRLTWPNANDKKRARVAHPSTPLESLRKMEVIGVGLKAGMHIVDVSPEDIQRHYHLTTATQHTSSPTLQTLLSWNHLQMDVAHHELFEHFYMSASKSLAIFGHDPIDLGYALVRLALADESRSSKAVWYALLAFSATHKHQVYAQSVQLKIAALGCLAAIPGHKIGMKEAIRHIAAGMLLCSLEIQVTSCTSQNWTRYLDGAKQMIKATKLDDRYDPDPDLAILLEWVYYHDVLTRFASRYWSTRKTEKTDTPSTEDRVRLSHTTMHSLGIIELLSDLFDAISTSPAVMTSAENSSEHKSFLKIIDWKIRNFAVLEMVEDTTDDALMNAEIYKLAMLVYLSRASDDMLSQAAITQQYIDQAFARFAKMDSCHRQLPLFVLGCEARTDDQRMTVLDLISRSGTRTASRSLEQIKILMEALWAQDDLSSSEIKYTAKLDYLFSCCRNIPSFV